MRDTPTGRMPLMLDVDTGVDDALAIAFAVRSDVRLVGLTTVAGNISVDLSTRNTLDVLSFMGAESVPVHRGASRPLAVPTLDAAHVHGENGLGGAELGGSRAHLSRTNAIQAIIDAAEHYDGELVIVALGPLTNIAMAASMRPDLTQRIRRLVIMSGAFFERGNVTPHAEFNAFADPHALDQVLRAPWNDLIAVGLDATHRTAISRDQWERISPDVSPSAELVRRIAGRTFVERKMDGFYLHDPLAVAVAVDPSFITTTPFDVRVELSGEQRGKTVAVEGGAVQVATDVDVDRFEQEFVRLLELPARHGAVDASRTD